MPVERASDADLAEVLRWLEEEYSDTGSGFWSNENIIQSLRVNEFQRPAGAHEHGVRRCVDVTAPGRSRLSGMIKLPTPWTYVEHVESVEILDAIGQSLSFTYFDDDEGRATSCIGSP